MIYLKNLFNFYLKSSIHVAISAFAFIKITYLTFCIPEDKTILLFVFFGTITAYNFTKYYTIAFKLKKISNTLKTILLFSILTASMTTYYFLHLTTLIQTYSVFLILATILYTIPFMPNKKNLRNWPGIKIIIIAICWTGTTLVLPLINAELNFNTDFFIKLLQRLIFIFNLILIFDIADSSTDLQSLATLPQTIGVKNTKITAVILFIIFCALELLQSNHIQKQFLSNLIITTITLAFLYQTTPNRSIYYTSFWAENIPFIWYLILAKIH